jgi:cytochrome c
MNKQFLKTAILLFFVNGLFAQTKVNVLVFSKTAAFRHQSIEAGKTALAKMAKEKGFGVSFTEDAAQFTELNLKRFNTVIFLNTTGDILNNEQQNAFERYIQAGGGYVGIHAATDTEYEWPWYNQLAGAWFLDHPMPNNVQKGRFYVTQKNEFTAGMPDSFERSDEFYAFKDISPKINVVLKIDEKSYTGGKNGDNHPMSWYQEFQGGRSFYTAMGHTDETFSEPLFLNHLYAGIKYTTGGDAPKSLDFSKARPEENRFTKVVLEEKLDEPVELSVLDKDRVLFIQRKGEVRLYNSKTKTLKTIAKLPVSLKYVNKEGKESVAEDGLLGLNKDPKFAQNQWIYLYYSSTKGSYNVLSRFTMKGDEILMDSEKEMLRVETQREECCHTGGSIDWDKQGNLYLSTGDNTNPHASNGYSPSDERPGRSPWDAQKSSANTNDLRGKILRIKPNADGTYSIPSGNLFAPPAPGGGAYSAAKLPPLGDGGLTRPEIYTMGHRNPYRISVDPKNSKMYWGDVGPDASKADPNRGPDGTCEFGQASSAGNYGWPHFVGDNKAYNKFDFASNTSGDKWDYLKPINTSPNNTGLTLLPEAKGAMLWYGYGASKEFPLLGAGGCNPMAGPVYYKDMFATAPRAFPKYYDGKFFAYEWMRGWVMAVSFDKDGNYASMERFMPSYKFSNPMDMEFAENGDLYMLEYGSGWFTANDDARLIRIEYNGFNRKPQIQVAANQMGGAIPFNLKLSAKGTSDADGDPLKYSWKITSKNGFVKVIPTQDANLTLTKAGVYKATLTVNDGKGGINSQSMEITAGNEPPILSLDMPKANKSFYIANKSFDYEIKVKDKEDGDLDNGIAPENVAVNIDYLAEGFDKNMIAMGHRSADEGAAFAKGKKLIEASDCMACHKKDSKSIGPSYRDVSVKYKGDSKALETLTKKILSGGSGVWGETAMAAHPQISTADASEMVKYILNISNEKPKSSLPVKGSFTTKAPASDKNKGVYIVRAAYEDQGANGLPALKSEQSFVLRNTKVDAHGFDEYVDINKMAFGGNNLAIPSKSGAYMVMKQVDLTGVSEIQVGATAPKPQLNAAGGAIEARLGSPTGALLGRSAFLEATEKMDFTPKIVSVPVQLPNNLDGKPQDIYLIFSNPKADAGSLMVVMSLEFKLAYESSLKEPVKVEATAGNDFFVGKWATKFIGTPGGDAAMDFILERNNGVLKGKIVSPQGSQAFDKVEETDAENIKVFFKANGMDINVSLQKEDGDNFKGRLMGMFDVKGAREK